MKRYTTLGSALIIALINAGCGSSNYEFPDANSSNSAGMENSVPFAPYKDVTIAFQYVDPINTLKTSVTASSGNYVPLEGVLQQAGVDTIRLGFATGTCGSEVWGTSSASTMASAIINELNATKYVIATGGNAGAFLCSDATSFGTFISSYKSDNLVGVDLDIESGYDETSAAALVTTVTTFLKNSSDPVLKNLFLTITLATLADSTSTQASVNSVGAAAVAALQSSGYTNYAVNLMTMDYGTASAQYCVLSANQCQMGQSAIQAAKNLNAKYNVPFKNIALTPMIGDNDTAGESFTLDDVSTVKTFAEENDLAGLYFWSFDRDTPCTSTPGSATYNCNTVGTAPLQFTNAFLGK